MKVNSPEALKIASTHSTKAADRLRDGVVTGADLMWADAVVSQINGRQNPDAKKAAFELRDAVRAQLKTQKPAVTARELAKDRAADPNNDAIARFATAVLLLQRSLAKQGHPGNADGLSGPLTRREVAPENLKK